MTVPSFVESWSAAYSGSAVIRTVINFAHLGGLVAGGGCAIAADRAVLMAYHRGHDHRTFHLQGVHATHLAVLAGLALVIVSGVLLFGADLDAYVSSTVFWVKMGFVALLLGNGLLILGAERRAGAGDENGWLLLRRASIASLTLWFATTLAGVILPNAL
jgi:uncharacterized membrane protein